MSDGVIVPHRRTVIFGPFRFLPAERLLLHADHPVRLGSRAIEILTALVERAGDVVSKDELVGRVWPDTFVDEGNLRVHIAALRRALGDGVAGSRFIATVPGRGYSFVAALIEAPPPTAATPAEPAGRGAGKDGHLGRVGRVIGRDDVIEAIVVEMPQRRFTTIVGPGGIGKTTVALAAAYHLAPDYADGVRFVDLAPIADPSLAPSVLAAALGVAVRSENAVPGLVAFLRDKSVLIVIDNCEHVVDAAASLAENLFKGAPSVHILATSREPLRVEGERVLRLASLAVPDDSATLTAVEAVSYPAVQLFVERATANLNSFELTDTDAAMVADICRRLDGIALAIELAAVRVDAFGVAGLAELLNDRFRVLTSGRRTALPRHQTLLATLDWSYDALTRREKAVLCRLAVFAGPFTLNAAVTVADDGADPAGVVEAVPNLVAKSLVSTLSDGRAPRYRLLDTTRAYALAKLRESGELAPTSTRHAVYFTRFFDDATATWAARPKAAWMEEFNPAIDNTRAALDWAFSPDGDETIGVALTTAAIIVWTHLALLDEGRVRTERAGGVAPVARPRSRSGNAPASYLGLAAYAESRSVDGVRAAWTRSLEIANGLGDDEHRLRAGLNLWIYHYNVGQIQSALDVAKRSGEMAEETGDTAAILAVEQQLGISHYALGNQDRARHHIDRMLADYRDDLQRRDDGRFVHDQRSSARSFLARILWLQGFPDQALATMLANVADKGTHENTTSLANALVHGIPVAFWVGDFAQAHRLIAMLLEMATKESLVPWQMWGRGLQARLSIDQGEFELGLEALEGVLTDLRRIAFVLYYQQYLGAFAYVLGRVGRFGEAIAAIDEALARADRIEERWSMPELLRIKGGILAEAGSVEPAEQTFLQGLELARKQGALSWQLRNAKSLARLWVDRGRDADASALLSPIWSRFTEGFGTADLIRAKALLDELGPATASPAV